MACGIVLPQTPALPGGLCTHVALFLAALLVAAGRGCSWLRRFSPCGAWMLGPQWLQLVGSSTGAQELWLTGSAALWHLGSSRTED